MPTFNLTGSVSVSGLTATQLGALITAVIAAIPSGVTVTMANLTIAAGSAGGAATPAA